MSGRVFVGTRRSGSRNPLAPYSLHADRRSAHPGSLTLFPHHHPKTPHPVDQNGGRINSSYSSRSLFVRPQFSLEVHRQKGSD